MAKAKLGVFSERQISDEFDNVYRELNVFMPQGVTTDERDALTAENGMIVHNTTTNKLNVYLAGGWEEITSA